MAIIVPPPVKRLLDEADRVWRSFNADMVTGWQGFIPADLPEVYHALKKLKPTAPGNVFLEWGSGIGTIAIMADMLGYEAYGIEINRELVERAEDLASAFDSKATFAEGSFIPDEYVWNPEIGDDDYNSVLEEGSSGYEALGMDPEDFDVIYGYPWPGEEALFEDIFDQFARPDAVMVCYHSLEHVRLHRVPKKVRRRRRRERE